MKVKFFPPSLPVVSSSTGIKWSKYDKEATYLSLFQNVALKGNLLPKYISTEFPRGIPYNYSCPSTKDALMERVCTHYGLYLGNIKYKQNHSPNCGSKNSAKSSNK